MEKSHPHLVWASKPNCSRPVAELWLSENDLLFVMFVDDLDRMLKIEILPASVDRTYVLDFAEMERLIEAAKRELQEMASRPTYP